MRHLLNIVISVMLVMCIILLLVLISANDRAREASLRLEKRLAELSIRKMHRQRTAGTGDFVNREYFSTEAVDGGTLTTAINSDPPGLNPLLANEASAQNIYGLCAMTLAERDLKNPEKFRPYLAESFTIFPDRKTYYVKLRKGVLWHSFTDPDTGKAVPAKEVTAHDIKFTLDVILNPDVNCASLRTYYMDIKELQIINDHEFIVVWKEKYYGSLSSTMSLFPLPRHFYAPDGNFDAKKFNDDHKRNRMIVGCGPYIFREWNTASRQIKLERNEDYIGFDYGAAPAVPRRNLQIIQLPNTQFQSLLAGKIGILSLTPEQWHSRTNIPEFTSGKFRKIRYSGSSYSYIGYNQQLHCFSDSKTRRALTMLINRQEILDKLMYGCGKVAKGPFVPGSNYSDPEIEPLPYDPESAKKLLREAGWQDVDGDGILERNGKKFTFTMLQISGSSMQNRMLPMIQNYFAAAGIDMKLQTVEWSVLLERLNSRDFEACNLGWTGTIDPDLYQIFHSSQAADNGDNFVNFKNAVLDEKIVALRKEFDLEKRIKLGREIEKIIHEEQPYTFMFYPDALLAISQDFENIQVFQSGLFTLGLFMRKEALL